MAGVLACTVAGLVLAYGCSSDSGTTAPATDAGDSTYDADQSNAHWIDGNSADYDPTPPPGLPDGWDLERTYDKHCGIYVPHDSTRLPPPVAWEACPATAQPAGIQCNWMKVDWDSSSTSQPGGADTASVTASGNVLLNAYRNVKPNWSYTLIAEADGPVRNAVLNTNPTACIAARPRSTDGRYTMTITEHAYDLGGGLFAGSTEQLLPTYSLHLSQSNVHSAYAAPFAVLDFTRDFAFDQYSWTSGAPLGTLWSASMDKGAQQAVPVFASSSMVWGADYSGVFKIHAYSVGGTVVDLLSAGADANHGYDDPGTDGKDLVWIYAQAANRVNYDDPFDTYTIMTSPFATDPTKLAPRRLRTEQGPVFGDEQFVVGCGYAARTNMQHVRVVRLADGVSWTLDNPSSPDVWGWTRPLAMTCDELFAIAYAPGVGQRVVRVRLDSLGTGLPPD